MADTTTHSFRKRMSRIYLNDLYAISDRYNSRAKYCKKERSQTIATAICDMNRRGFSTEAIHKDLEDLCITTYVDIEYLAFRVVATPPSHFVLCNR